MRIRSTRCSSKGAKLEGWRVGAEGERGASASALDDDVTYRILGWPGDAMGKADHCGGIWLLLPATTARVAIELRRHRLRSQIQGNGLRQGWCKSLLGCSGARWKLGGGGGGYHEQ